GGVLRGRVRTGDANGLTEAGHVGRGGGAGAMQGVDYALGAGIAGARIAGGVDPVLGLVVRIELGLAGEVADSGERAVSALRGGGSEVQERVLGLAGAVIDAVRTDVRHIAEA